MTSFGVMTGQQVCPCSSVLYAGCCGVFHQGELVQTPEQLLRSRYSAYVYEMSSYILSTWHPKTRPMTVEFDTSTTWLGLDIGDQVSLGGERDETTIAFKAHYLDARGRWELRETSHFERRGGRWFYRDGDATFHQI